MTNDKPVAQPVKWYLRPVSIIIAVLAVGPFAIPLIWRTPILNKWQKIVAIALVVLLTFVLLKYTRDAIDMFMARLKELQEVMQ